ALYVVVAVEAARWVKVRERERFGSAGTRRRARKLTTVTVLLRLHPRGLSARHHHHAALPRRAQKARLYRGRRAIERDAPVRAHIEPNRVARRGARPRRAGSDVGRHTHVTRHEIRAKAVGYRDRHVL